MNINLSKNCMLEDVFYVIKDEIWGENDNIFYL